MNTRTEKVINDIKSAAAHAEELLENTTGDLNEKAKSARLRLNGSLDAARRGCEELERKAVAGLQTTEETIKAHPYKTVAIALGVGVALGLLLSRRD